MDILIYVGIGLAALLLVGALIMFCRRIAGTNEVLIVSGLGESKTKTGGGIFVVPFFQKVQKLTLENIQVDFTSRNEIPTKDAIHVLVDAVANMSISKDPERQKIAASKFADYTIEQIRATVIPVLEGNIREIISQTNFEDLIRGDKKAFSELVMENVTPNLADLGIDLTTFNIQNYSDNNGVIQDLGIENIEKIKKDASIAAARAQSEVAIEKAKAQKEANDARVAADTEIAQKNNELAIERSRLQIAADKAKADADIAGQLQTTIREQELEVQKGQIEVVKQEQANLAAQKEADVIATKAEAQKRRANIDAETKANVMNIEAEARVKVAERDAKAILIKADADADKVLKAGNADAEVVKKQGIANAEVVRQQGLAAAEVEKQQGLAKVAVEKEQGLADAIVTKEQGLAEAESIRAKLMAEADGQKALADALASNEKVNFEIEKLKIETDGRVQIATNMVQAMAEFGKNMEFVNIGGAMQGQGAIPGSGNTLTDVLGAIPALMKIADVQNQALNGKPYNETLNGVVKAVAEPVKGIFSYSEGDTSVVKTDAVDAEM